MTFKLTSRDIQKEIGYLEFVNLSDDDIDLITMLFENQSKAYGWRTALRSAFAEFKQREMF